MALELVSRFESWRVCDQKQDVRGMKMVDDAGISLGVVRDLMVNTETGEVERLVLDNRAEYPVSNVAVTGDTLHLRSDDFMTGGGAEPAPDPSAVLHIRCERV
jgi:sporulation protein YlmC with PRC-barrel domain